MGAITHLSDLNGIEWWEAESLFEEARKPMQKAFSDVDISINNLQLGTATILAVNSERDKFQVMIVPAGQGKSRIEVALAVQFLLTSTAHVNFVYANRGLKDRDEREYSKLWSYLTSYSAKIMSRLHHLDSIAEINKTKKNIIIVDESDDVIFTDLEGFYTKTCAANSRVICLTATVHDGKEKGSEVTALEKLGFKTYRNAKAGNL